MQTPLKTKKSISKTSHRRREGRPMVTRSDIVDETKNHETSDDERDENSNKSVETKRVSFDEDNIAQDIPRREKSDNDVEGSRSPSSLLSNSRSVSCFETSPFDGVMQYEKKLKKRIDYVNYIRKKRMGEKSRRITRIKKNAHMTIDWLINQWLKQIVKTSRYLCNIENFALIKASDVWAQMRLFYPPNEYKQIGTHCAKLVDAYNANACSKKPSNKE